MFKVMCKLHDTHGKSLKYPMGRVLGLSPRADLDVVLKKKTSVMLETENPAVNQSMFAGKFPHALLQKN
jgi:hypothetical protein